MNIRCKYTLFLTNKQPNSTLFLTNNQSIHTLFLTNKQPNSTLFLTNNQSIHTLFLTNRHISPPSDKQNPGPSFDGESGNIAVAPFLPTQAAADYLLILTVLPSAVRTMYTPCWLPSFTRRPLRS